MIHSIDKFVSLQSFEWFVYTLFSKSIHYEPICAKSFNFDIGILVVVPQNLLTNLSTFCLELKVDLASLISAYYRLLYAYTWHS